MTKQEQYDEYLKGYYQHKADLIEKMAVIGCVRNPQAHTVEECSKCDFKQGQCNAYRHAEALYSIGYRKVPDGAVVLTPEERDDEMKATNEILAERDDLIAKVGVLGRENYDLKAENKQLKTECALLDDELRIARQDTIDVLNKLKTKSYVNDYCREVVEVEKIDEMIRLKDENKQLHTNADILARGVRDLDHENYELTEHIEHLEAQNAEEIKILLVEDGSIDFDDLAMFIDEHDLKIKIVVYRQGSVPPRFLKQAEVEE